MPGAEVQANAIWTAMHGLPLRSAPPWVDIVVLALLAGIAPFTRWRLQLVAVGAMTVVAGAGPEGLRGDQIPLAARICSVCDVFDALLSPRPYKHAWPLGDVIKELAGLRGTHLDPALVDAFLPLAADLHAEWFTDETAREPKLAPPGAAAA